MSRPRLTLCIIARDEAELLPKCLASVRNVVDRIVLVDTGSRDATREVAVQFGAKLVEHEWRDDFAAARNAGLAVISRGFVLVLDADERLAPGAGHALRRAVRRGGFDLGLMPLHDASALDASPAEVLSGAKRRGEPQWLPRLLRWGPELRYEGIIHESVGRWAIGKRLTHLGAPIIHLGAVPEQRSARGKSERNLRLLRARAQREPDQPLVRAYLARELERAGQTDAALAESTAGWEALVRAREAGDRLHEVLLPATVHVQQLLAGGRLDVAREVLAEARAYTDEHPNTLFLAGVCAEQQALDAREPEPLLREAAEWYTRCLKRGSVPRLGELLPGAVGWQAELRLATVTLRRGEPDAALRGFARVLQQRSDLLEAQLGHAEARLDLGAAAEALRELEPHVAAGELDAWGLAAEAASLLGASGDAALFAERVRELEAARSWCAPHRRARFAAWCSRASKPPVAGETPVPCAARRSVLVWPSYEGDELDVLLRDFGKHLAGRADLQLFIVHDGESDGDAEAAVAKLERAYAAHIPNGALLEVVFWTEPLTDALIVALADEAICSIALPESGAGARSALLERLGAPQVSEGGELARMLVERAR